MCKNEKKNEMLKDRRSKKPSETLEAGSSRGEEETGGMKLSHFPSQSVVKLVSQSKQTVPSQWLLLNSPFHGCRGRGSTHFAKHERTLYMAESPRIPSPLRTRCQNIDTGGGKQAAFYSHISDTLSF